LVDIDFALSDLYSVTEQKNFDSVLGQIIKHLDEVDLELFIRLYLNEELFSNSTKIVLDSIHNEAYNLFVNSENSDEVLENFSNTDI
jgi:hypothetical protein